MLTAILMAVVMTVPWAHEKKSSTSGFPTILNLFDDPATSGLTD